MKAARQHGFTVIELLVSISILTVIVFALYQMFNQTQKALRGNVTQVDVMESGRAAMEMISRELGQMTPCRLPGATNLYIGLIPTEPLMQFEMGGTTPLRTNVLQEVLFLRPQTNKWFATGYRVIGAENGVGTLYRFGASTNVHRLNSTNLTERFWTTPLTNAATRTVSTDFHRVTDGVVHLRIVAYDFEGRRMGFDTTNGFNSYRILRQALRQRDPVGTNNVVVRQEIAGQSQLIFLGDAAPASLEIELGVLEAGTFEQYKSIRDGSPSAAVQFLKTRASKVHIFRQRIPIRTAVQSEGMLRSSMSPLNTFTPRVP